jgi:hypothetical protein
MRKLKILILFTLVSCGLDQEISEPLVKFDETKDVLIWNKDNLPLNIFVDDTFSDEEIADFDQMVSQWEFAANTDFVNEYELTEHKAFNKLEDYYYKDATIGLHRATIPVDGLGQFVLGSCQLLAKYNHSVGDINVYEILHADIVINDYNFDFSSAGDGAGYDLKSIFLHEIGHFIGLLDNKTTVMKGTMRVDDIQRVIDPTSEQLIYDRYSDPLFEITNNENNSLKGTRSPSSKSNILLTYYVTASGELKVESKSSRPCHY